MLGSRSLEDMISHRVTFDLVGGRRLVGYLAGLGSAEERADGTTEAHSAHQIAQQRWRQDAPGAAALVVRAQLIDPEGRLVEERPEVKLMLSSVLSYRVTEGPGGF